MRKTLYESLSPEDKDLFKEGGFRWSVANAALRTNAATSAYGGHNIRSFVNSYGRTNHRFKIGYDDSEFSRFLDAAEAIMFKKSRDSGTPAGFSPILGEILTALGVPGAGLILCKT